MFSHITQKILTTDTFHWLVLIPNSQLSYRYSVWEKQPLGFLKTSEDLQENNKKTVFLVYILRLWKLIKDNTSRCLHCMYSFFLKLETVFSYIKYIPHLYLSFFIFLFLFHLYLTLIATRHFLQCCLVRFHCKPYSILLQYSIQKVLTKLQGLEASTRGVL